MTNKIKIPANYFVEISGKALLDILVDYLELPKDTTLVFKTAQRSDYSERAVWTEVTGVQLSYKD